LYSSSTPQKRKIFLNKKKIIGLMTHMTDAETDQLIGNLQTAEIKR
jgi:hypothetical protein